MQRVIKIGNREHLLSTLAEAAELEHNLMCTYLYAAFSLKTEASEDLSDEELQAVKAWRASVMSVAVQEMTHLALVANITSAVGGAAHFFRPDFPVKPGYFPDEFVIELAAFDQETLQHFIFLERPEDEPISDDRLSAEHPTYKRQAVPGRLMAHVGDYRSVGELYAALRHGLTSLADKIGERALFCGQAATQLTPDDVELPGLAAVNSLEQALTALQTIVEQGEGARTRDGSHFATFTKMQEEYQDLLHKRPGFRPARAVVRSPVLFKPVVPGARVWVEREPAAAFMDLGNAIYNLMLRCLQQIYAKELRPQAQKKQLLDTAFALMHGVAAIGSHLTTLQACESSKETAGLSFTMSRHVGAYELAAERFLIREQLETLAEAAGRLARSSGHAIPSGLVSLIELLKTATASLADRT